jgi:hypothetical protein
MNSIIDFSSLLFPKIKSQEESLDWKALVFSFEAPVWKHFEVTKVQEPATIWSLRLCLALAQDLITEKGLLDLEKVEKAREFFKKNNIPLFYEGSSLAYRLLHIKRVLTWLSQESIQEIFEKITIGRNNLALGHVIKLTAQAAGIFSKESLWLSDRWVRVCVLSAWLHYLRQVVGSCFATAPAILVQQHQPEVFLKDMRQILENGYLKRTFDGKEMQVPAADDPGMGDLRKPFVLESSMIHAPGLLWSLQKVLDKEDINSKASWQLREKLAVEIVEQEGYLSAQTMLEAYLCHQAGIGRKHFQEYIKRPVQNIATGSLRIETTSKQNQLELLAERYKLAQEHFCLLTEHPLLRAWEFTLASFSDIRTDYCLWSLHTSLGLNAQENEGLAQRLFEILDEKVKEYNAKTHDMQPRCEDMDYQVQHLMVRLQSAKDEHELSWLRAEYQNMKAERDHLIEERDSYHYKASGFADLFHSLLDEYIRLFEKYFQQVYDPGMRDARPGPYEDSPAGFRLVFKSGRSLASSWVKIENGAQYIDCVARFLIVTEQEILSKESFQIIKEDISHIVTLLIQHIRSERFLTKAFERMAKGLGLFIDVSSLQAKENSPVKPWAYTSGGTMGGLVSHYYGKSQAALEKKSWFQDVQELWVFLIDTMKDMETAWADRFKLDPTLGLLMHSNSHAFLCLPGHATFMEGWEQSAYPYTWIRDSYIGLVRECYSSCFLEASSQELLLKALEARAHIKVELEISKYAPKLRSYDLRREIMKKVALHVPLSRIEPIGEKLDSLLLEFLPIHDLGTARRKMQELCLESSLLASHLGKKEREWIWQHCESLLQAPLIPAAQAIDIFYQSLRRIMKSPLSCALSALELRQEMARFGLCLPLPVFFADSNWDHYHFAFVLSPGTDQLEIWRLKPDTHIGYPMSDWKNQFGEKAHEYSWGIYNDPKDYLALGWQL